MTDKSMPGRASNQEKAEGDRDTARHNADEEAGGITNRPLSEEIENQEDVPPRGQTKREEGR